MYHYRLSVVLLLLLQKPGKWCSSHIQIAWQIYYHQQKVTLTTAKEGQFVLVGIQLIFRCHSLLVLAG
jgi:hypothetical protein